MHDEILKWYEKNKRDLPWRKTTPWGVLVSEFMLQQTPVSRVLPIWNEWMRRWPTPQEMSKASKSELLKAWGGLGYPRRALRLHETSKIITEKFGGLVPKNEIELRSLPGVGEYTAAAIQAFAFKQRSLVLDVNVRRLFFRMMAGKENPNLHVTQPEKSEWEKLMPEEAHLWAAATMELGATICISKKPRCEICPVAQLCEWRRRGYPTSHLKPKSQSWHGTDRQCRGTVMKFLRENDRATKGALSKIWSNKKQLEKALQSLMEDGLIQKRKSSFFLAE